MEVVIMYKRDPRYDGTILQGLIPHIKSESSDTKPNSTPRRRINNIVIQEISNLIFDIYFMIIRIIDHNVNIITFLNQQPYLRLN